MTRGKTRKRRVVCLVCVLSLIFTTGCWDRQELSDRAFVMATGVDLAPDGSVITSVQVAIPGRLRAEGGGNENTFAVLQAKGKNMEDSRQKLQAKSSRRMFAGHRKVVFIGEKMAKHGLKEMLDEYSRNSEVRLRSDIVVVKGGEARELIKQPYKLEKIPSLAAAEILNQIGGRSQDSFRVMLMDEMTDGSWPTLPAMQDTTFVGRAIFNRDLQLVGYLPRYESGLRFWILGGLRSYLLTEYIPEGEGYVTLFGNKFTSQVQPVIQHGHMTIHLRLTARGEIFDNGTVLDLSNQSNVKKLEQHFSENVADETRKMIEQIQEKYGADVFRFGEAVHRQYPDQWQTFKHDWPEKFRQTKVIVDVEVHVKRQGLTTSPLHVRRTEVKGE